MQKSRLYNVEYTNSLSSHDQRKLVKSSYSIQGFSKKITPFLATINALIATLPYTIRNSTISATHLGTRWRSAPLLTSAEVERQSLVAGGTAGQVTAVQLQVGQQLEAQTGAPDREEVLWCGADQMGGVSP